jgi:hypothetical protein
VKVQVVWPDKRLVDEEIIIGWATDILMDEAYEGQCACDSSFPCEPCKQALPPTPPTLPEALFIVNDRGAATTGSWRAQS